MSHFHRRKFLQGGVVALANFVVGEPLSVEAQTIVFPHLGGNRDDIFARIEIVTKHRNTCMELSGSGIERVGILMSSDC